MISLKIRHRKEQPIRTKSVLQGDIVRKGKLFSRISISGIIEKIENLTIHLCLLLLKNFL